MSRGATLIVEMLIRPRRGAEEIGRRPRWLLAFVLLAALGIIAVLISHGTAVESTIGRLPSSVSGAGKELVRRTLDAELPLRCAFLPFRLLLGWGCSAAGLFLVLKAWRARGPVAFRQLLAIEICSEGTTMLGNLARSVSMLAMHNNLNPAPWDLGALLPSVSNPALLAFASSVNPFSLWYIVILTAGVQTLYGLRTLQALAGVLVVWALSVLINGAVLLALRDAFHLAP